MEYRNPEELLMAFVDPRRVGNSFALSEWTVEDEISQLVDMIRDPATGEKTRLQAMNYLRKLMEKSLLYGGLVRKVESSGTNESGVHFKVSEVQRALTEHHEDEHLLPSPEESDDESPQVHRPPKEIDEDE
jgi:hypothetical protein